MSICACGKRFDTDFELGKDDEGNCCCDDCLEAHGEELDRFNDKR